MQQTEMVQQSPVSFFPLPWPDENKILDWRYKTYELLSTAHTEGLPVYEKKIYWIGIIDLSKITDEETQYPLSYAYQNGPGKCALMVDQFIPREVDGKSKDQYIPCLYNMYDIHEALLEAKKEGNMYYHILVEECVTRNGGHTVSLLHHSGQVLGIPTAKPWIEEPVTDWVGY